MFGTVTMHLETCEKKIKCVGTGVEKLTTDKRIASHTDDEKKPVLRHKIKYRK
jgi:hypothetical protein